MKKRMALMLIAALFFLGAVGFVKYRQIQTAIAQGMSWQPPPEAVTTVRAEEAQWPAVLGAIGSVEAVHGVTVSADLPGVVESIKFESGSAVRAGDILITLDTRQERAQLAAAEAQRDLARVNLERIEELRAKGVISQAEYDQAAAESKSADARAGEIEAVIARKTIRAPFSGSLGIRQVDLGQYLSGGDGIVPLQSLDPIYVDFSVPQQQVAELRPGAEVRLAAEGLAAVAPGRIDAVNSIVDDRTRNVQVQAVFRNPDGVLRPGMFVTVEVLLGEENPVVAVPASSVNHAPYGDSVFIVEEMKSPDGKSYQGARQQFVQIGEARGDQVAVLTGLQPGQEVVTSGVFKLRHGAAVLVNNEVQPSNNPAPRPEDS